MFELAYQFLGLCCVLGLIICIQRLSSRNCGCQCTGSFAGLGFLAWYLSGKIKVFDGKGHAAKLCIVLLPYLVAALVGVSRVDDYWHHWTDVFTGAIIGLLFLSELQLNLRF